MAPTCRERLRKIFWQEIGQLEHLLGWDCSDWLRIMKVLLAIPHVFAPKEGSLYSSQTEAKRGLKQEALLKATIGNLNRHRQRHWIHASLGKNQPVVNRELSSPDGVELTIRLFTPPSASLADGLPEDPDLERLDPGVSDYSQVPLVASRHLLEHAQDYDLVGYMEDDLILSDPEFFAKILYLDRCSNGSLRLSASPLRTHTWTRRCDSFR